MLKYITFFLLLITANWLTNLALINNLVVLIGKLLIITTVSWHLGCYIFKKHVVKKLGRVDPRDKAIFITGCDTGFGQNIALDLNEFGFHVYAGCLFPNDKGALDLKRQAKNSNKLTILHLDVSSDESVKAAFQQVQDNLNNNLKIFAVINNAGIGSAGLIEWTEISEFKRIFEVNFFGPLRVTKAFLPLLRQSKGRVVDMSSLSAIDAIIPLGSYGPSKAALANLDKVLRREMDFFGVKVITILPSFFKTNITSFESDKNELSKKFAKLTDEVRSGYGEEMVNGILSSMKQLSTSPLFDADLSKVTRAVNLAVTLNYPEHSYSPQPAWSRFGMWFALEFIPFDILQLMHKIQAYSLPLIASIYGEKLTRVN